MTATPPATRDRWWALPLAVVGTGVGAGVVGALLTLLLHACQHLAFGYGHGTFLEGLGSAPPWRRALGATVVGLVAGPLWWWQRRRLPVPAIREVVRSDAPSLPLGRTTLDAAVQILVVAGGASVGREGAPRQAAAAVAALLGAWLRLTPGQRRLLVACGAGAGLAAVYDVPVTGVAFALETAAGALGVVGLLCAAVASAIGTVVAWPVVGAHPVYALPATGSDGLWWWVPCSAVVCGLAGSALRSATDGARSRQPSPGSWLIAGVAGVMALMGLVLAWQPALGGNGKALLEATFAGGGPAVALLAAALAKAVLTALCLRAGVKGGLLTPALAVGGVLGGAAATLAPHLGLAASLVGFVVVGMAPALAASRRAPLVGVLLTVELTHPTLPVGLAAVVAGLLGWGVDGLARRLLARA